MVAEILSRRFFDVIQVLSHAIPLIAIQASVVEVNGQRALTFTKILDAYEEPEEGEIEYEPHNEAYWLDKAAWTNEAAKALAELVRPVFGDVKLNYVKNYVSLLINDKIYFWLHKRAANKSLLNVWLGERVMGAALPLLDAKRIPYRVRQGETLLITMDVDQLQQNADTYHQLALLVKDAWTGSAR